MQNRAFSSAEIIGQSLRPWRHAIHNLEIIIFRFLILKIKKFFGSSIKRNWKKFFSCRIDTVTQYLFCTLLSGCAKKTISLRFIYWAKSATLRACCSQFRNNYFEKIFVGSANWEMPKPFFILKKKKFFYFTEKKYIDFALKECYN